ncbi:MAG: hypothetical protein HKM06_04275 [Spirochaetales bacterium]|nr:hypothetical protein [Spirochaetales bacterium]
MSLGLFFCGLLAGGLIVSCTPSQPQIVQSFTQLNHVFDPSVGKWQEKLAVWVQVDNKDGWGDVTSVVVHHPAERIWWRLDPDNWSVQQQGEAVWIGTNSLQTADGSPLPTGTWDLTVVTKAQKTAEMEFSLTAPLGLASSGAPKLEPVLAKGPPLVLKNFTQQYLVWAYDSLGAYLGTARKTDPELSGSDLASTPSERSKIRWLVFYSFDKSTGNGTEAGPFPVSFTN